MSAWSFLITRTSTSIRTQSIWFPPVYIFILCLSFYTYTHLAFAELGTETFNINVIPGQTVKWLLEHFQSTYSSTGQRPAASK